MTFQATKAHVLNRGVPPDAFLAELVAFGRTAPDEIFAENDNPADIYSSVSHVLGPWEGLLTRKAAMLEVMRVLAAFESSWNWSEGVDTTNPTSITPETTEAGAWQVSYNSRGFGPELKAMCDRLGIHTGTEFQVVTKANHPFAMEYIARLLRRTCRHNGPVLRHEIDGWLRRDAVAEFAVLLAATTP